MKESPSHVGAARSGLYPPLEPFRQQVMEMPGGHRVLKRGTTRGTVASAILAPPTFLFAAGPPDRTPFVQVP